jgi:hypothetical protein
MFQLNAWNYCDDIFAETADVVIGDAWLPEYRTDWRGTNVVVIRNRLIEEILLKAVDCGDIALDKLTVDRVSSSQDANFKHRRDGLSVRLADNARAGKWTPSSVSSLAAFHSMADTRLWCGSDESSWQRAINCSLRQRNSVRWSISYCAYGPWWRDTNGSIVRSYLFVFGPA